MCVHVVCVDGEVSLKDLLKAHHIFRSIHAAVDNTEATECPELCFCDNNFKGQFNACLRTVTVAG